MTGVALTRPVSSIAWDLRSAWAAGRRVALTLEGCDTPRLEGRVTRVAATDAYCSIEHTQVPMERIAAVHYPSLLGDSTYRHGNRWSYLKRTIRPQVEELPL